MGESRNNNNNQEPLATLERPSSFHLEDRTSATDTGSLSSRVSWHLASSSCAASRAGAPVICPRSMASFALKNRPRHSGGSRWIPRPLSQPKPSLSNPGGTAGMPGKRSFGKNSVNGLTIGGLDFPIVLRGRTNREGVYTHPVTTRTVRGSVDDPG